MNYLSPILTFSNYLFDYVVLYQHLSKVYWLKYWQHITMLPKAPNKKISPT